MHWNIPGTVLQIPRSDADRIENTFSSLFLAGGITLGQITDLTGLEPYTVQNWVKRRYVSSPKGRMYDVDQFSRLVIINMLKQSLQLDSIVKLLSYINGQLDDRSDDIITDSELYHLFVSLLIELNGSTDANALDDAAEHITVGYVEPSPGARRRLCKVMIIMAQSYFSSELKKKSELLMCELD